MENKKYIVDIKKYRQQLKSIINEVALLESANGKDLQRIFRKYPKSETGLFRKSDVAIALNTFVESKEVSLTAEELDQIKKNLRTKETRTISGVTPVTVLTKPFPCPGKCIFCPNDVRMPKSYLSDEPGAQRATRNKFDPYAQTFNRLLAYKAIGHATDKIELIILGGTWTSYPETYQIWYVKRCFDAMNDFHEKTSGLPIEIEYDQPFEEKSLEEIDGTKLSKTYNQVISQALLPKRELAQKETATWDELFASQIKNESSIARCVGLVIETRPDEINEDEIIRIRKLGATKTQIGFQSLNDDVLEKNKRGHDVNTTRKAVNMLRSAGFKIHAHWMPNLYGSNPEMDIKDFKKMFSDPDFKPDELKVYPCSLIASAELMQYYKKDLWKPYTDEELTKVLTEVYKETPKYCRITRMIRDIGSQDIVTGNKKTNFRQIIEQKLQQENAVVNEIRSREIRNKQVQPEELKIDIVEYDTSIATEYFIQYINDEDQIAGFLRLSLPKNSSDHFIQELKTTAIIREIHIYGQSIKLGSKESGKAQHLGLGKNLIQKAEKLSLEKGFKKLAVISSVGTREYYRKNGFNDSELYQIKSLD